MILFGRQLGEGAALSADRWRPATRAERIIDKPHSRQIVRAEPEALRANEEAEAIGPRAHFTVWHEITHLLLHPPQLAFPHFRRTPPQVEIEKDALESAVDHVAGPLAFYPPLNGPALEQAIATGEAALSW